MAVWTFGVQRTAQSCTKQVGVHTACTSGTFQGHAGRFESQSRHYEVNSAYPQHHVCIGEGSDWNVFDDKDNLR
jgi:hypothetical protein